MTITPHEILEKLIEEGKITREVVHEYEHSYHNQSFRTFVEGLHALMCDSDHDTGECLYHNEAIQDHAWDRQFHKNWSEYGKRILKDSDVGVERMLDDLRRVSQVIKTISELTYGGRRVLWDIIERSPVLQRPSESINSLTSAQNLSDDT